MCLQTRTQKRLGITVAKSRARQWLYTLGMIFRHRPRRLPGDNPLLRRAFIAEYASESQTGAAQGRGNLGEPYRQWLTARGIDPDSGKMSAEGLEFFKTLLDADRASKSRRRRAA